MSLLFLPLPSGHATVRGRVVTPLGPEDFNAEEERKVRRAEACARYRAKNTEAVNARVQAWRERKKQEAA